jgi:hypothetical protein
VLYPLVVVGRLALGLIVGRCSKATTSRHLEASPPLVWRQMHTVSVATPGYLNAPIGIINAPIGISDAQEAACAARHAW